MTSQRDKTERTSASLLAALPAILPGSDIDCQTTHRDPLLSSSTTSRRIRIQTTFPFAEIKRYSQSNRPFREWLISEL